MNGGWPSDQLISFSPPLNRDRVEVDGRVWPAGFRAGGLDDCRADMTLEKHKGCKRLHTARLAKARNWKQPSPLWNLSLVKLTSSTCCDLFDKFQTACRKYFRYQRDQCSCIDTALILKLWCLEGSHMTGTCAEESWEMVVWVAESKPLLLLLTSSRLLMSLNSSSCVPSFVWNIKKVQTPHRIQKADGLANTQSSGRQNT